MNTQLLAHVQKKIQLTSFVHEADHPLPLKIHHSPATGLGLCSNGKLGADLIRVEANSGFVPHTHPGDHLLVVLEGAGTLTYDGYVIPTFPGQIYLVEGSIPHAVGAIENHVLMSIGSPHKRVDDPNRMTPVEYQNMTTDALSLHCLICDAKAIVPQRLHHVKCPHCPCASCNPYAL